MSDTLDVRIEAAHDGVMGIANGFRDARRRLGDNAVIAFLDKIAVSGDELWSQYALRRDDPAQELENYSFLNYILEVTQAEV